MQSTFSQKIKTKLDDNLKTFRIYEIIIAIVCIGMPMILRLYDKDMVYPVKVKFLKSGVIIDSASNVFRGSSQAAARMAVEGLYKNAACYCDSIPPVTSNGDSVQVIDKDRWCFRTSISDYAYSTNSYLFGMLLCIAAMLFIFNGAVYFRGQQLLDISHKGKWYNILLGLSLLGVICCPHRDWPHLHYLFAIVFFFGNTLVIGIFHNRKDRIKSIVMATLTAGFLLMTFFNIEGFTLFWGEWFSLAVIAIHFMLEARRAT
ncbi:MAG: hypothetical protein ABI402_15935 [Ferruginibacter sp.]